MQIELKKSFFAYNEGLSRRFPFRYTIEKYTSEQLGEIFIKKVKDINWNVNIEKDYITNFFKEHIQYFNNYGG
jgi:hypothetical protein